MSSTNKKFDSVALYRIRKLLSDLSNKSGRGTELVTLYLPPKKPVHEAIAALREESGTASNIKSDTTRNHVQDALTKTMARLRLYNRTPENGIVIFCGAIPGPGGPGNETIELYEVLPQKPVTTYLYRCVAPETRILLSDGTEKTIRDLKDSWSSDRVLALDSKRNQIVSATIARHLETSAGERKVFRLSLESGRQIVATEDHPFYTPRGWVRLGLLHFGDLLCINPVEDLGLEDRSRSAPVESVLLDEQSLRKIDSPPANMGLAVRRLKERGLLPLRYSNPQLGILARLIGHIFSDGSLTHNVDIRKGMRYSHHTVDICIGSEVDAENVRSDLARLGVKAQRAYPRTYTINLDGRSYTGHVFHIKLRDTALCTLLRSLGAPVGSKVANAPSIPGWLLKAPLSIQREFLAAYLGGDGEASLVIASNPASAIRIVFHRTDTEQGMKFARDLESMFSKFGVIVSCIRETPSYTRKKRGNNVAPAVTHRIELRFSLTEENVLKISHAVGFRYCERKATRARLVGEYLRIKARLREAAQTKMARAQAMKLGGSSTPQISEMLQIKQRTADQWSSGRISRPLVRVAQLPAFDAWLEIAGHGLPRGLVWESVTSIERLEGKEDVMDLTIDSEDHSFFANGFLVHNCDDHFHLDPLRDMLREQDVVGILSVDATEAGLGIVSGDVWDVVDTISSGVSGKTRKGGQCVSEGTLVQLENGSIVPISEASPGSMIVSYDFAKLKKGQYTVADNFSLVPKEYFEIETRRPHLQIRATSEHRFFTVGPGGFSTKQAFQLNEGDRILVTQNLPEPSDPNLETRFPARFVHRVTEEGRARLKQLRIEAGKSQAELATALGLHQSEISQLERGERDLKWKKLQDIVRFLAPSADEFNMQHVVLKRVLPEFFSPGLLQLMGYIAGDGCVSDNRVALYEQRRIVAETYAALARETLGLEYVPIIVKDRVGKGRSFAKHEYFEVRIYSKHFAESLTRLYSGLVSESREIPRVLHRLDNRHLASFIRGLFDAEGFVRERRIGISMKSELLIRQLQLLLLRFGIVSSYSSYVNQYGSRMNTLDIGDRDSVRRFRDCIGFSAPDKHARLQRCADRAAAQGYLNVAVLGSTVDRDAKLLGIRRRQFAGITNFFTDTRGISPGVFSRVIKTFQDELSLEASSSSNQAKLNSQRLAALQEVVGRLSAIADGGLILAYVHRISKKPNTDEVKFYDIELPETRSFVGNGFLLHNSARRYERLREMELTDYFNRLADHAKKSFLEQHQIKGLIVSGPGPTKDEFVKDKYLDYRLQNAIVGVLDTGYSGREGVRETIEKSGKLLENVRVVEERKLVQRFLREVNSENGLAIYGIQDIIAALKKASVDTILISDDIDTVYIKATCRKCGNLVEKFARRSEIVAEKQSMLICPKCGSNEVDITERDIVDYFADASIDSGANVEVISSKTEDGSMLKSFGGIAALLRYRA